MSTETKRVNCVKYVVWSKDNQYLFWTERESERAVEYLNSSETLLTCQWCKVPIQRVMQDKEDIKICLNCSYKKNQCRSCSNSAYKEEHLCHACIFKNKMRYLRLRFGQDKKFCHKCFRENKDPEFKICVKCREKLRKYSKERIVYECICGSKVKTIGHHRTTKKHTDYMLYFNNYMNADVLSIINSY